MTIHKSQRLSLKHAIVEAGNSIFTRGQIYVALSRVTTLNGLHLINYDPSSMKANEFAIKKYNRLRKQYRPDLTHITISKKRIRKVHDLTWTVSKCISDCQNNNTDSDLTSWCIRGFLNQDNVSCYANAPIQCLLNSPIMRKTLLRLERTNAVRKLLDSYISNDKFINVTEVRRLTDNNMELFNIFILIEILSIVLKTLYYICETIYRVFIPVEKKNVAGEIVLITGAAQGIGKELALGYASLGGRVVCWDIHEKINEETVNEIKRTGGSAYAYKCDVSNREEIVEVAEKVKKEVGDVTILINNAGIAPVRKFLDWSVQEINQVINVNLKAHFWTLKEFLPSMIEKNHGHIVTISSLASFVFGPHGTTYCASKAAVTSYMECLRQELNAYNKGNSINITLIYPSFVRTKLVRSPNFRFPNLVQFQSPQKTAAAIIDAQRRNLKETSVPSYFLLLIKLVRLLPYKTQICLLNFLGINVEVDDPSESYI